MFIRNSRVASECCVKSIKIYAFFLLHSFVFYWNRILETKCNQRSGLLWTFCGNNSSLKNMINFRKKYMFRLTSFYATFQCGRYTIFRKIRKKDLPPKTLKNCPQKLLIIPLDQQFSFQHVSALCNCDSFIVWNFLILEVVKLWKMKKYPTDST